MKNTKDTQKFIWRENDESSSTFLKYDLEANHWVRAFKSAERKHNPPPINETFKTIGLVLSLIFHLISLFALSLTELIKYLRK